KKKKTPPPPPRSYTGKHRRQYELWGFKSRVTVHSSFFDQHAPGHAAKGAQLFTNILSTATPTAIVGKWVSYPLKDDWLFFEQISVSHVLYGL
ncbi:hypothetical protein NTD86_14680, partial [Pseudomonas sp. 7P_10.2_Bac1]|uniref:hypothetical protein n=1 Tax=Pseudomonas sp. 7P_10.2_Bac1 TaxID=2971614 RepID=UPI0021C8553E